MGIRRGVLAPRIDATLRTRTPHTTDTQAASHARLRAATEEVELAASNGAASAAAAGVNLMDLEELSDIVRCVQRAVLIEWIGV